MKQMKNKGAAKMIKRDFFHRDNFEESSDFFNDRYKDFFERDISITRWGWKDEKGKIFL